MKILTLLYGRKQQKDSKFYLLADHRIPSRLSQLACRLGRKRLRSSSRLFKPRHAASHKPCAQGHLPGDKHSEKQASHKLCGPMHPAGETAHHTPTRRQTGTDLNFINKQICSNRTIFTGFALVSSVRCYFALQSEQIRLLFFHPVSHDALPSPTFIILL